MISIIFDIRHFVLPVQAETPILSVYRFSEYGKEKHKKKSERYLYLNKMVWQKMVGTHVGYATTLWWKCSTPLFSVQRQGFNCSACQTAALDRITALQRDCEAAGRDKSTKCWCVWPSAGTIYNVRANIYDPQGANLPPSKGHNLPPNNREGK